MKQSISLLLASVLFISQSLFLSERTQANTTAILNEDTRLLIADQIEAKGMELQNLSDFESMDVAIEELENLITHNLIQMKEKIKTTFDSLSEDEASTQLSEVKSHLLSSSQGEENLLNIVNASDLTSKQKLSAIYETLLVQGFEAQKSELKDSIQKLGFKKPFSSMADQFRSRSFWDTKAGAWIDAFWNEFGISIVMALAIYGIGNLIWPGHGGSVLFLTLFLAMLYKCRHNFFTCE